MQVADLPTSRRIQTTSDLAHRDVSDATFCCRNWPEIIIHIICLQSYWREASRSADDNITEPYTQLVLTTSENAGYIDRPELVMTS